MPEAYKAITPPARAVEDISRITALAGPVDFSVRLCPADGPADRRFTLYLASTPATLTDVLPLLQQLGLDVLDERPSEFVRADGLRVHVYDFSIRLDDATRIALDARPEADIEREFCAAFGAAWRGDVETDRFSALVLRAGLPWREAAVLRAYARYARQIGALYGLRYMADTLLAHPDVARGLLALFRARFDPALPNREEAAEAAVADVRARIDDVVGLDADRILRSFGRDRSWRRCAPTVPRAAVPRRSRSTRRGCRMPGAASAVRDLRVLAVGRGSAPAVRRHRARRVCDGPTDSQDFRTEILGLVKAQAVKNAVIVPVGAKGGFVVTPSVRRRGRRRRRS